MLVVDQYHFSIQYAVKKLQSSIITRTPKSSKIILNTIMGDAKRIPTIALPSSSHRLHLPVLGMGTCANTMDETLTKTAVVEAIMLGYRHFDTASLYGSEKALGEAIVESLELGYVGSRDELFVTSKLWCTDSHPHRVLDALKTSLRALQLEYLDLYLVHWPLSCKPGKKVFPPPRDELLPMDFKGVWAAMEECQNLGLTKAIGVSNFSCKKLADLLSIATIPPSVNQVEMHPLWQQRKLREFCNENGIVVTAYSPLGARGTSRGSDLVLDNPVVNEIANARGKTAAQVCLRWVYEQGVAGVVKSYSTERMTENMSIFGWELSEDDYKKIKSIPQQKLQPKTELLSPNGPYKSLAELWDGEI